MAKFKFYKATVTYMSTAHDAQKQYTIINQVGSCYERTEDVFSDETEALLAVIDSDNRDLIREDRLNSTRRIAMNIFSTHSSAMAWVNSWKARVEEADTMSDFDWSLDFDILDNDDLSEYQYDPKYEVVLEVKTVKRLTVTIDSESFPEVEDEYDAGEQAIRNFEDGDYDDDLDYEDVWDTDVDVYSSEED